MMNNNNDPSKIVSRKRRRITTVLLTAISIRSVIVFFTLLSYSSSFSTSPGFRCSYHTTNGIVYEDVSFLRIKTCMSMSDDWGDAGDDSNTWTSAVYDVEDWDDTENPKNDGSSWATFESIEDGEDDVIENNNSGDDDDDEEERDDSEMFLDMLASIAAEEIEFNRKDNERADKVRQMQEWGFDDETIKNAFGVEVDDSRETQDEVEGMKEYREELYVYDYEVDEEDWNLVESHTMVEKDPETGEAIRQQMVYVDEHACIGCYNCANIAQSTFFMEEEHGRARVFSQWGDDDDTIACAIETCPVDCIHYVSYDELVRLETERRGQNINFKARLVNQGEAGNFATVGATAYTAPQEISGNIGSRCNNCPSRGCKNCPMFGVGKNPEFERREQERKLKIERKRLQQRREEEKKSVEL